MGRLIIGLFIGLILGGALTFYFFVGVPQSAIAPGVPIQAPDSAGLPAGTAQIVLRQQFLNEALGTILQEMSAPAFPVSGGSADCDGRMMIKREGRASNGMLNVEVGCEVAQITVCV